MLDSSPIIPPSLRARYDQIVALTDDYCAQHGRSPAWHDSADEVAARIRDLLARIARKANSPLARGQIANWAAAAVHCVARVNDMFGSRIRPVGRLVAKDLASAFGLSATTPASKARQIDKLLNVRPWDPRFVVAALRDNNPTHRMEQIAKQIRADMRQTRY
ncbi:MAG: DUF6398 domain-containing protein [Pirellulaceae bacterium]